MRVQETGKFNNLQNTCFEKTQFYLNGKQICYDQPNAKLN